MRSVSSCLIIKAYIKKANFLFIWFSGSGQYLTYRRFANDICGMNKKEKSFGDQSLSSGLHLPIYIGMEDDGWEMRRRITSLDFLNLGSLLQDHVLYTFPTVSFMQCNDAFPSNHTTSYLFHLFVTHCFFREMIAIFNAKKLCLRMLNC